MKKYILSFVIFSLLSCDSHLKTCNFTTISSLIDRGKEDNKPSLIYLSAPGCTFCELFDYKILADPQVKSYINNHFLFYKVDISTNLFFSKLLYFYGAPVLIVLDGEKIMSLVANTDQTKTFLFALENYKMTPLELNLARYTGLQGNMSSISKGLNEILSVLYHQEKADLYDQDVIRRLENTVEILPCFYSKYLLSKEYEKSFPEKSRCLLDELSVGLNGLEMMLFSTEMQNVLEKRFHLNGNLKSEIKFEHQEFNFGEVNYNDVVVHKFPFKNTSPVPLLIYTVNSSCGCTVSKWEQRPILSGLIDTLTVQFTASSKGKINKTINVISNGKKKNTVLTITASVK